MSSSTLDAFAMRNPSSALNRVGIVFGGFTPNRGETFAVVSVAQDARAVKISLELAREYLRGMPSESEASGA